MERSIPLLVGAMSGLRFNICRDVGPEGKQSLHRVDVVVPGRHVEGGPALEPPLPLLGILPTISHLRRTNSLTSSSCRQSTTAFLLPATTPSTICWILSDRSWPLSLLKHSKMARAFSISSAESSAMVFSRYSCEDWEGKSSTGDEGVSFQISNIQIEIQTQFQKSAGGT